MTHCFGARAVDAELFFFSVGSTSVYAVDAFSLREVVGSPTLRLTELGADGLAGALTLREESMPVWDAGVVLGVAPVSKEGPMVALITQYNGESRAYLVRSIGGSARSARSSHQAEPLTGQSHVMARFATSEGVSVALVNFNLRRPATASPSPCVQTLRSGIILCVDDSEAARMVILDAAVSVGREAICRASVAEAWSTLLSWEDALPESKTHVREAIDLVMIDADMPECDGYELARKIKADTRFAGIRVGMHSSEVSQVNGPMARFSGVDFIVEGFDAQKFAYIFGGPPS